MESTNITEEEKEKESLVYGRDEYAKKQFWDDRFKEYLIYFSNE